MSEVATYLKVGTTALILDMIEDGFFDRDYTLQSPVQAIRDISHDPTLRETVRLKDGRAITALQLQIEYLEHATRYVADHRRRPGHPGRAGPLDRGHRGARTPTPCSSTASSTGSSSSSSSSAYMEKHRLSWRDPKVSLIDLQYHDIRPDQGLYYQPRPAATWSTASPTTRRSSAPSTCRPQTTRARLRGEFIRQANLKGKDYRVDWVYLKLNDPERETILCKDPFQSHDERVERLIRSF